jgi:hypothetical protein
VKVNVSAVVLAMDAKLELRGSVHGGGFRRVAGLGLRSRAQVVKWVERPSLALTKVAFRLAVDAAATGRQQQEDGESGESHGSGC